MGIQNSVNSENVNKITEVLRNLNSGNDRQKARNEAMELVKNINSIELSLAEQQLIQEGVKPTDLRDLCTIHMEVLQDELTKTKSSVKVGHPLHTFIEEHQEILKLLDMLDEINKEIQKKSDFDSSFQGFGLLKDLADKILAAENHHLREENVLFPEFEKRGITGPTRIMRMEHDDLRDKKHRIQELSIDVARMNYNVFKEQLNSAAEYLVYNMRDHIFKEDHILYPSALKAIDQENVWDEIQQKCDEIGYCPFTPRH